MEPHVLVAVTGFGVRIVPAAAPYRIVLGGPQQLDIQIDRDGQTLVGRIIADGSGSYRTGLGDGTPAITDVVTVEQGPLTDGWQIATEDFSCALPADFVLCSSPPGAATDFDLVSRDGSVIFVQTPEPLPKLTRMAGPDQRVSASGAGWVELTYVHDGHAWWQRHQIVGRHLITAQALASFTAPATAAVATMIASLVDVPA